MTLLLKKSACIACAAVLSLGLFGCGKAKQPATVPTVDPTEQITLPTAPIVQETVPETTSVESVEHLSAVLTAGELYKLEHYPNLKSADLSGSTCYDAILNFMAKHPELDITYTVEVGSTSVFSKDTSVSLEPGSFDFALLLENLQFLPNLTSISLPDIRLDTAQVETLLEKYPELKLEYTVDLFGNTFDISTTELDLSYMDVSMVDEAIPKLGLLTNLEAVTLSNNLSLEDVAKLQDANTHTTFRYTFTLFGKTLSTTDEEVIYKNHTIGNDGEAQLRQALAIMDNCKRFVLDNCGLDNEVLAGIREDFRDGPKVIWRVYFGVDGRYNTLTDDDVIRCVKNITDDTCGPMKYLEDVVHADLGHNDTLTDLSFVGYWPKLETLIASGCAVKELTGFENCKNLIWLELAYCAKLKDVTPLAGCESLKYLNLSYTGVSDYMPLDGLPLERFMCLSPKASTEEQNIFISIHPRDVCYTMFYGTTQPYGKGWRYNSDGKMFAYYKDIIREVFNYDQADAILDAQKKAEGK